jgi:glycine dehydrogenase subunit 1
MPFIPHTSKDVQSMLSEIGETSIDALFDEIPSEIFNADISNIPQGMNELSVTQLLQQKVKGHQRVANFVGAGAYEHHIPAAVWELTSRGEFLTAYTPYQAEASQGTLQLIYEFQTMIASLCGMDVANASMYDGASALAEAVLMAVRLQRKVKNKRIIIPDTLSPVYKKVVDAIVYQQGIELIACPYDDGSGQINMAKLKALLEQGSVALVIPYPNYFGVLEQVDELTNLAHSNGALVIASANPVALGLLKSPGSWGEKGADIVCGELQPFGMPLASGGPYAGFMSCKKDLVRQMPGRIVGMTHDVDGKTGYTLTLQAREQHIRRSKATSNICTNQGLLVTAATIHMSLLGPEGVRKTALACHQKTLALVKLLETINGVRLKFKGAFFHEFVLHCDVDVSLIAATMLQDNIFAGLELKQHYDALNQCLLVCVTETKTQDDLQSYQESLLQALTVTEKAHV